MNTTEVTWEIKTSLAMASADGVIRNSERCRDEKGEENLSATSSIVTVQQSNTTSRKASSAEGACTGYSPRHASILDFMNELNADAIFDSNHWRNEYSDIKTLIALIRRNVRFAPCTTDREIVARWEAAWNSIFGNKYCTMEGFVNALKSDGSFETSIWRCLGINQRALVGVIRQNVQLDPYVTDDQVMDEWTAVYRSIVTPPPSLHLEDSSDGRTLLTRSVVEPVVVTTNIDTKDINNITSYGDAAEEIVTTTRVSPASNEGKQASSADLVDPTTCRPQQSPQDLTLNLPTQIAPEDTASAAEALENEETKEPGGNDVELFDIFLSIMNSNDTECNHGPSPQVIESSQSSKYTCISPTVQEPTTINRKRPMGTTCAQSFNKQNRRANEVNSECGAPL